MRYLLALALAVSGLVLPCRLAAAEAAVDDSTLTPEQRQERVRQELLKRRRERDFQRAMAGGTFQPKDGIGNRDPNEKVNQIVIQNLPVGLVAQMYANLLGKEVVVSAQVAPTRITARGHDVTRSTAISLLEEAMIKAGVKIERTGDKTVTLGIASQS